MNLWDLNHHFHFMFSYICVRPSDFFYNYFSFKATNKNWTKNIIIISYQQICAIGVGLGIFWHWVIYIFALKWVKSQNLQKLKN